MINRYSKAALAACCLFILLTGFLYYPKWKQQATEATLSWDVSGYYFYLPAAFIYKDLTQCGFADSILARYSPTPDFQQAYRHPSGNYVMKYTMGQTILFAPFFFAGHIYATLSSWPPDGFSYPYQMAISLGMFLYAFAGLFFLQKALLYYFSDKTVAATLLLLVFATNYLNYAAIDSAMTHNTLFTLYSVLLYMIIRFYRSPQTKTAVGIGLLAGLITLTRPTECLCLLLFIGWDIAGKAGIRQRWLFIQKNIRRYLVSAFFFVMVLCCQFVYWKWSTGEWFVYSYRNEGFSWLHPQIINGLVSYKGGWLLYTPVMVLLFPGLVALYRAKRPPVWCIAVFCLLFMYTCFSWEVWWYGAGLGQRAMIQGYPVMSFAIAAAIQWIGKKKTGTLALAFFILACACYNLWLTHQAHKGGLFKGGEMNGAYFWAIFGRNTVSKETEALLDNEETFRGDTSYPGMEQSVPVNKTFDKKQPSSIQYFFHPPRNTTWVRAAFFVATPQKEWETWKMPQAVVRFYHADSAIKTNFVRISRLLSDGESGEVVVDAKAPASYDSLSVFLLNTECDKPVWLQKISVRTYHQ